MTENLSISNNKNILDPNSFSFEERQRELQRQKELDEKQNKRKKQSPFSNWYQFNREHTSEMIWLATKHPKAQAILLFLLDQMDEYNAVICSYQVLQEALELSSATITRAIKVLKENGFLAILKSGTSNVYIINKKLAWSSWGNNMNYCKFPVNVVLSIKENEEYIKKIKATKVKQLSIEDI